MFYGAHAVHPGLFFERMSGHVIVVLLFVFPILVLLSHCVAPPPSAPSIIDQRARLPLVSRQVTTGQRSCRSKYPTLKWPSWSTGKVISLGGVHSFNVAKTI